MKKKKSIGKENGDFESIQLFEVTENESVTEESKV